jgi:hypothetical protein
MLSKYLRRADTSLLNLTSRFAAKLNISDTSNMLVPYLRKADTTNMLSPYFRDADTSLLNLTSRFAAKLNISDTLNMLVPYLRKADTTLMLSKYLRRADTSLLNLTSRLATKLNISDTAAMLANYNSRINLKLNISDTAAMLIPYLRKLDTVSLSNRINLKVNISDTSNMLVPYLRKADTTLMLSKYLRRADTSLLNLTSRFAAKLNISDTASMLTNYLRSGVAASTYLPLTGGTLTGDLYAKYLNTFAKTTYIPFNAGIGEQSIFNVGTALRGGTVMVFPDSNLVGSSANIFLANSSVQGVESSAMGSGMRNYAQQGGDTRRNSLAFYTSGIGSQNTNRLFIDFDGNVGINDDTPSYKLDVNGTLNATGAATLGSTLAVTGNITEAGNNVLNNLDTASLSSRIDSKYNSSGGTISGAVTLSTTTATPTSLLGKDGSNVVGTVTTVAQTGLMTRGLESNRSTTSGSELISVTHNLGSEPTSVLITVFGSTSYILQVASKTGSTFTVQVKNYDGTPAIDATLVSFSWLAIK